MEPLPIGEVSRLMARSDTIPTIPELDRIEIDGLSIAYRRSGVGPALVLLHGFLCDSRCWRRQLADLADHFTVIAWDAPGAGSSSDPAGDFSFADWSRYLAAFLDRLGVATATIVGLSWGGVLAQELYRHRPSLVARLVLADTYAGWKGSLPETAVAQRLARCEHDSALPPAEFVPRWVPEMFSESAPAVVRDELGAIFADFHPRGFRLMAKSLGETDTTDLLRTVRTPTLVLWGDSDSRSPVAIGRHIQSLIPQAELRVMERTGHVSNMEQAATFNELLLSFVQRSPVWPREGLV
jgi:pimeloyl-ACP methyl ester carboxylesterase